MQERVEFLSCLSHSEASSKRDHSLSSRSPFEQSSRETSYDSAFRVAAYRRKPQTDPNCPRGWPGSASAVFGRCFLVSKSGLVPKGPASRQFKRIHNPQLETQISCRLVAFLVDVGDLEKSQGDTRNHIACSCDHPPQARVCPRLSDVVRCTLGFQFDETSFIVLRKHSPQER